MARWLDDSIKIDFKVSAEIKNLMIDADREDEEGDYNYFNDADSIDIMGKEAYVQGIITKEQWDLLARRYRGQ